MPTTQRPTCQKLALRLLPYIGITSLSPQPIGSELESVLPSDLEDVAWSLSAAMQEIFDTAPTEDSEVPQAYLLRGPTNVTVTATEGSQTVVIAGYAAWMLGCTIRITGDTQDNEILSSTTLAQPFLGTTGAGIPTTVYNDAIVIDDTVKNVIAPYELPNQWPIYAATSFMDWLRFATSPLVTDTLGNAVGFPFPYYYQKTVSRPRAAYVQGFYNAPGVGYVPRRIRIGPMPDTEYTFKFKASLNPPRYSALDITTSPNIATVTGGLTQSLTEIGEINGEIAFSNASYVLYFDNIQWVMAAFYPAGADYWASTTLVGAYTAHGSASGVPVVAVTSAAVDPGTLFPIPNGAVEAILYPIARKMYSGTSSFKNQSAMPEIDRSYKQALAMLHNSRAQISHGEVKYL